MNRRTLLQTIPLLAFPLPALANPLAGLKALKPLHLKVTKRDSGVTIVSFYWWSPDNPQDSRAIFETECVFTAQSSALQTDEEMTQYTLDVATLTYEDLWLYQNALGETYMSTRQTQLNGLIPKNSPHPRLLTWQKEHGVWVGRLLEHGNYRGGCSRPLTREEWLGCLPKFRANGWDWTPELRSYCDLHPSNWPASDEKGPLRFWREGHETPDTSRSAS